MIKLHLWKWLCKSVSSMEFSIAQFLGFIVGLICVCLIILFVSNLNID